MNPFGHSDDDLANQVQWDDVLHIGTIVLESCDCVPFIEHSHDIHEATFVLAYTRIFVDTGLPVRMRP
jgi:hypothetical protein